MAQQSIETRNAALNAKNTLLNGGTVELRTGTAADIDDTPTGTILVIWDLPDPAFSDSTAGIASLNSLPIANALVAGTGEPYHYVAKDSIGNPQRNGSAGTSSGGMIISNSTWSIGDPLQILNWTVTETTS